MRGCPIRDSNGKWRNPTAREMSPDYNWDALIAVGVKPNDLLGAESQIFLLVRSKKLNAKKALALLELPETGNS